MNRRNVPSVVPWRTPEDFRMVYKKLYSDDVEKKRWAVEEILIWQTRVYPSLPSTIEATVYLVRCVIMDAVQKNVTLIHAEDVRLMYSTAIVRFVNMVIEPDPDDAPTDKKMFEVAEMRNIPKWIVELRHEASHTRLPSLEMLRLAANKALGYLENIYWKPMSQSVRPMRRAVDKDEMEIKGLVAQIKDVTEAFQKRGGKRLFRNDCIEVFSKLNKLLSYNAKDKVLSVLAEPGVFICEKDAVKILTNTAPCFLENRVLEPLPMALENFWLPLLQMLHSFDTIPTFMVKLLSIERPTWLEQKLVAAWVKRILEANYCEEEIADEDSLEVMLRKQGMLIDKDCLLYACMKNISPFLIGGVLELIISHMDMKSEDSDELSKLAAIKLGWLTDNQPKQSAKPPVIFTAQDAEDDMLEQKNRAAGKVSQNKFSYTPMSLDLSNVPFGAILNPIVPEKKVVQVDLVPEEPEEQKFIIVDPDDADTIASYETIPNYVDPSAEEDSELFADFQDMIYRPLRETMDVDDKEEQ